MCIAFTFLPDPCRPFDRGRPAHDPPPLPTRNRARPSSKEPSIRNFKHPGSWNAMFPAVFENFLTDHGQTTTLEIKHGKRRTQVPANHNLSVNTPWFSYSPHVPRITDPRLHHARVSREQRRYGNVLATGHSASRCLRHSAGARFNKNSNRQVGKAAVGTLRKVG